MLLQPCRKLQCVILTAGNWPARRQFLSSLVGLVVDSAVFLYLAFGSLDFITGQIIGKGWMVLLALPAVAWLRARDDRLGLRAV